MKPILSGGHAFTGGFDALGRTSKIKHLGVPPKNSSNIRLLSATWKTMERDGDRRNHTAVMAVPASTSGAFTEAKRVAEAKNSAQKNDC